jgi:adenylate cyclase
MALDPDDSLVLYNVGCCYALEGEPEKAIDCLERAVVGGYGHKDWLENDSDLNSIRQHPRFLKLMETL